MNTNTRVTLLFHLLNENLPKDVVYFIIVKHYLVPLRIKAFHKECYYHRDFSGGKDNIACKFGIKTEKLKSLRGCMLTQLTWKESNSFWRGKLLVSSIISVIKNEKGYKIYSDLDKDFDLSKGTIYSFKKKYLELKINHFNTWCDKFMIGYQDNVFYNKSISSISIFRDHLCGYSNCESHKVKKVMYHGTLVRIYKNSCDTSTEEYLKTYYF